VLKATLQPAIAFQTRPSKPGVGLSPQRGIRHGTADRFLQGHLITLHGGDLPASTRRFRSCRKTNRLIVFELQSQPAALQHRQLQRVRTIAGHEPDPWSDRQLEIRLKNKKAGTEARTKANEGRIPDTKPSHPRGLRRPTRTRLRRDEHRPKRQPASLRLSQMRFSMTQFHYDRFDTPDDEQDGKCRSTSARIRRAISIKP